MKEKCLVFGLSVVILILLASQASSKAYFSSAYDVEENASKDMIVINLKNSSYQELLSIYNSSRGNFSLERISVEDAKRLNNSGKWIWVTGDFYELRNVVTIEDKHIISIEFNATPVFNGSVERFFNNFDEVDLKIIIRINEMELIKDNIILTNFYLLRYPDSYQMDYLPAEKIYVFEKKLKVEKNGWPYPLDSYFINFTVRAIPTVINNTQVVEGVTYPTYGRREAKVEEGKLVYFGNLTKWRQIISDNKEEGIKKVAIFEENSIFVKSFRNNKKNYLFSVGIFALGNFFLWLYLKRIPKVSFNSKAILGVIGYLVATGWIIDLGFVNKNFLLTLSGLPYLIIIIIALLPLKRFLRRGGSKNGS